MMGLPAFSTVIPKFSICLKKGSFAHGVLTLMTGTTLAQIIPLCISPILTRLYLPEDFGILALFTSICAFGGAVITGKYDSSIMLPERDEDAVNILGLCAVISLVISVIVLAGVSSLDNTIIRFTGRSELSRWLYFVPMSLFLAGLYQSLSCWSCRKKQFRCLAIREILQSASASITKLGMGLLGVGYEGLIVATLIGSAVATGSLAQMVWKSDKDKRRCLSRELMYANAARYRAFPTYTAPQALLDSIRRDGLIFIMASFVGMAVVGWYSFAISITLKPLYFIGNAVSQVFYQRAAEAHNSGQSLWPLTRKLLMRLGLVGLPVFLCVSLLGPQIFAWVFGAAWRQAGLYAQLLVPWLCLQFITSPVSIIPQILHKQRPFFLVILTYNVATPVATGTLLWCGCGFRATLVVLSSFGAIYLVGVLLWIRSISR